jgi:CRISPR-associated protein Cas1
MGTLYIDRKHVRLDLDGDALVFHENGERIGTVPLGPLERIIVRGNVALDTSLLGKLGEHRIGVVVLSGRRHEPSLFLPRPHNDAERRLAQYRAASDAVVCLILAQELVRKKLQAQRALLEDRLTARPDARYEISRALRAIGGMLGQIDDQPDLAALRGIEGAAANSYFSAFAALVPPGLGFAGRNRRPPRDPVNAVLSLAYTLLHAEAVLAAHAVGLDPAIGFYHQTSFGRDSLACDLVEPLRAHIDLWVIRLFNRQTLRKEDFSTRASEGCLLGKAGRTRFYEAWETEAETVRRQLERQARELLGELLPQANAGDPDGFDPRVGHRGRIQPAE